MDATTLARIWLFLHTIVNVMQPTSCVSVNYEYGVKKITENFIPAIATEGLETIASTYPIDRIYETAMIDNIRTYRQAAPTEATAIETTKVTETSTPYELNDWTEKYDSLETTELSNTNKTVIPLVYDSVESPDPTNSNKNVEPTTSTLNYIEPKENNTFDNIETTSNKSSYKSPNDHWLTQAELDEMRVNSSKPLAVIGIPKVKPTDMTDISNVDKHIDRIMVLQPTNDEKYLSLKEHVHNLAEITMLKRETTSYVIQLNRRYNDLPVVETDNAIWRKYSRAVVENFVLEFCINYPHYSLSDEWIARWHKAEEYHSYYNMTLLDLKRKKRQTALQFAAPVRRAADIYRSILDTPIGIVQSRCFPKMPQWLCLAEYLVHLADESENCEHIWYHADVHLTLLQSIRKRKGAKDIADKIIDELESRLSALERNDDVDYLFDFIVKTLADLGSKIRDSLLAKASVYNFIRKLQIDDKLRCLNIDNKGV